MEQTVFERMGGTYTQVGDYLIPNLAVPQDEQPIGIWGQRHLRYIREHRQVLYCNLLTTGKLNSYLADIDEQAQSMFDTLMFCMAKTEGITEQLKAQDPMHWVQLMNNLRHRVTEIINTEIIYSI